jgi:sodium-dependent dicarboxylate transporter 2/3/5
VIRGRGAAEAGAIEDVLTLNSSSPSDLVASAASDQIASATTGRFWRVSPNRFALLGAVALMTAIYCLPGPAPLQRAGAAIALTPNGQACLGIMAFAVTLWVTEAIPFAVTSLLVLLLIPAFGITDYKSVVSASFGDPIVTFFIGVLMLSSAFTRSGLGTRLISHMLLQVGTRTDRVLLGFLVIGVLISMWITKMAVAAMLLPIGVAILRQADAAPLRSNFGRAIMIAVAFGPLIGGIATPVGTGANLVAIAQLKQLAQSDVSFARWMVYGLPACVLMVPLCWRILLWMFPPEIESLPVSRQQIAAKLEALGPLSLAERRTMLVFAAAIGLWLGAPVIDSWSHGTITLPAEAVGLGAGLCLFLPGIRVLSWKETERDIEWGGIILIAAGLALGKAVFESGAARWLAWILLGRIASLPDVLHPVAIVIGVAVLRLLFSSNTVAASIITPILIALARDLHLDAWAVVAPAAFSATLGFILVSQGPTTIIPYGAGYFTIKDMAKAGLLMTFAAAACIGVTIVVVNLFMPAH